ncbi:hypothetical protein [Actinomadura kijaniata]|uniref:hypothetical protein n=1 Tax=Actinomadura kijaniata TaxID=46161 RepID=UPI00082D256D|nr:hypothetical protein [Actinomadura kijaniata]
MLLSLAVRVENALAALAAPDDPPPGGGLLDNPAPRAPGGLADVAQDWLAWGKWGCLLAGALGLLYCAGQMAVGRRNRSHMAGEGAAGIPWTVAGLSLAAMAVPLATSVMTGVGS